MSTLVLGFICKDGALMASDGQVTTASSAGPMRLKAPKIKQINNMPILWGGATNDLGFIQKIEEHINTAVSTKKPNSLLELRPELVTIIHNLRREALARHRELYGERNIETTPQADVLFVEYRMNISRILIISKDGDDVWMDDFGYAAVGIGDSFAHTLLRGRAIKELTVDTAKILAYRVIEDAIAVSAFGMGEPIHIWVMRCTEGQKNQLEVRELSKTEIDVIQDTCKGWREAELDTFRVRLSSSENKA